MDEKAQSKKRKAEDLLIGLEEVVDKFKKHFREGGAASSRRISWFLDQHLLKYHDEVEFNELKGDWSPFESIKWRHDPQSWSGSGSFCSENFAILCLPSCKIELDHAFDVLTTPQNFITFAKSPSWRVLWKELTPLPRHEDSVKALKLAIFQIISENSMSKESLDHESLKQAIELAFKSD